MRAFTICQGESEIVPPRPKKIEVDSESAHRIRELRESREETQTSFALALGVRPSNVSKWESGKNLPEPWISVRLANLARGELRAYFLRQAGVTEGESRGAPAKPLRVPAKEIIPWDRELLIFVIETINAKRRKRGRKLTDRKYATLVAQCYDECLRSGRRDPDMMEQLLKIA